MSFYVIRKHRRGSLTVTEHKSLVSAHSEWAKADLLDQPIIARELDFTHQGELIDLGDKIKVLYNMYDVSPAIKEGSVGTVVGFVRGPTSARLFIEAQFDLPYRDANGKLWPVTKQEPNFSAYFLPWEVIKVEEEDQSERAQSKRS